MAGATPYMTSTDVIEAVKRRILIPMSQNTYQDIDILKFGSEEMDISQVPSILEYHENFFLFRQDVPIEENQIRYPIPDRAIGTKFKDLHFIDENSNEYKLVEVSSENRSFFEEGYTNNSLTKFYIEGNDVVLVAQEPFSSTGSLRFTYFLRPNRLVLNERAAICIGFSKELTVNNATLIAGDTFSIGDEDFVAGTDFAIGATSVDTATNLTATINTNGVASATNGTISTNVILIKYRLRRTVLEATNEVALDLQEEQGVEFNEIPENIVNGLTVDLLQTRGGHKTYRIDVIIPNTGISDTIINFESDDIPNDFIIGDYICEQYECIIPQIPDDLHISLVERICAAMLASMSDLDALKIKQEKIREIEFRQGNLIDNRAEGHAQKINNLGSHLRNSKRGGTMRRL